MTFVEAGRGRTKLCVHGLQHCTKNGIGAFEWPYHTGFTFFFHALNSILVVARPRERCTESMIQISDVFFYQYRWVSAYQQRLRCRLVNVISPIPCVTLFIDLVIPYAKIQSVAAVCKCVTKGDTTLRRRSANCLLK